MGLLRASLKLLPLCCVLELLRFLPALFKSGNSIPYSPPVQPHMQALLAFEARCSGFSFLVQDGELSVGHGPLGLGREPLQL